MPPLVLHVIALPHVDTTRDQSWCAYNTKVRRFCTAMTRRGHRVVLYGAAATDAEVAEFVACNPHPTNDPMQVPPFDTGHPAHKMFNARVIGEIAQRIEPRDFICAVMGTAKPVADYFADHQTVEFGIGYSGTFSPYRVFESYAWMHMVYGAQNPGRTMNCPANSVCDVVIPNLFDPKEFPKGQGGGGYYLYLGRLIDMKGWQVAVETTGHLAGAKLKIAGQGDPGDLPPHCEYLGVVGPDQRAELMGGAIATFVPTQYVEPFGGVHVESMLCGTPVITTDWGVFTETVTPEVGFRCRTAAEFVAAALKAPELNRDKIRKYALERFAQDRVAEQYEAYFRRLETLWGDGYYEGMR